MLVVAAISAASACGGEAQQEEYRQAGVAAGVAAALQVVQTARAQSSSAPAAPGGAQPSGGCCAVCRTCEFPCGDRCVLYGTLCADPPGCACTDATAAGRDQPVEPAPPAGCPTALPTAPVVVVPAP
jgi:hypothetical protein